MFVSLPSKKISPLSYAMIPATHLIRVDLPAPLSPTSAMTSPLFTSKSTSVSAWTEPKDFEMLRRSRSGASVATDLAPHFLLTPARERVQRYSRHQEDAGHDVVHIGAVTDRCEPVVDQIDDQHAEHSALHATAAAKEARAADYRPRDRVEQNRPAAGVDIHRGEARGEHDAAERRHRARDHEHHELDPRDVDARPARRFGVSANGVNVATERRPRRNEVPEGVQHENDHECKRKTAIGIAVRPGDE